MAKKFEKIRTECEKCGAISFGSKPGQKHRKCPEKKLTIEPGEKDKKGRVFPQGVYRGHGIWQD